MKNCCPCISKKTESSNGKNNRSGNNPYTTKIQILQSSLVTSQNLMNGADHLDSSSSHSKNDSMKPFSVKGFEVI
jgi:hypothetical protein